MTIKLPLPGDGIGPEIATVTRRVLEAADRRFAPVSRSGRHPAN